MKAGIYKIVNLVNGKKYIGSAINIKERWGNHVRNLNKNRHHNQHLQLAWNKYGKESFRFEVIEYCEPEMLIEREQSHIDDHRSSESIYNISPTAGSVLGMKLSVDARRKMSIAGKGRALSAEAKAKLSESCKGRVISKETREKISKSNKGRILSIENLRKMHEAKKAKGTTEETRRKMRLAFKGRTSSRKGAVLSAETKRKLSEAHKGKKMPPVSAETRIKLSLSSKGRMTFLGRKHTPETKAKMSLSAYKRYSMAPGI